MKELRTFKMLFRGVELSATRKNIMYLRLTIRADGDMILSVPLCCNNYDIERFLAHKWEWIQKKLAFVAQMQSKALLLDSVHIWGKKRTLKVDYSASQNFVELLEDSIIIHKCQAASVSRPVLVQWLEQQVITAATPLVSLWQCKMELKPVSFSVRLMKTRWGSCTPGRARIRFNALLATRPAQCLEYVIVHELAHMYAPDHGPGFYAILDSYYPDWRNVRKILKESPDFMPALLQLP